MKKYFILLLIMMTIIPNIALADEIDNYHQMTIKLTNIPLNNSTFVIRKGDLNKNGKIDLSDIINLLKKYLGTDNITADDLRMGDMNNNNKIDLNDIITLLRAYLTNELTEIVKNNYFINSDYTYAKNYDGKIRNKEDIIDFLYYHFNNGDTSIDGSCEAEYTDCMDDLFGENSVIVSSLANINNFIHPYHQIFNKDNTIGIGYALDNQNNFTLEIIRDNPKYTDEEITQINEFVDDKIAELITNGMSDYDKIKAVHDYIINNASYDQLRIDDDSTNDETYKSNTAYGVLFEGKGICSGYTDAMFIFLYKLGIKTYEIQNDKNDKDAHIWNLIYVNNKWYHLDATWDDPITNYGDVLRYDYFLIDYDTLIANDPEKHNFNKNIYAEAY